MILCDLVTVFEEIKNVTKLRLHCTCFHVTKTAINWRYFSSHAYNTMSTHLSGLHPWTIKSGLFVNMISNSLLLCAMKRIYWPRLWSFRGEREGSSYIFFTSVSSNIIHKLQIYHFSKKNVFLSGIWQKKENILSNWRGTNFLI